ncbi:MAG: glycosyltransferase family 9 protein [Fluviicola sp.]|nr:glycosyltransferase family 9 protein [Fluviicola sp.]MBP6271597.1 glycosyltransferase family 9 protein [Fluviicola sp.]
MKLLIVRFSSIGDVVLTTPVVRCLKQQLPDVTIHYITKKAFLPVLVNNPYIDRVITIEKSVDEVLEELKSEAYDYVIDLHHNVRTLRLKRALKTRSFAFPKENIRKFLLTQFKYNILPKVHVVDRYFEAVKHLGVTSDGLGCDIVLTEKDQVNLADYQLTEKQFLAVAMGAQFATKQLPIDLLVHCLAPINQPIVLLGGGMDSERAVAVVQALPTATIVDLTGKLSLLQSTDITAKASVLLTGDTGLMHLASAMNTPIVSVWGNTVPDFGMYPYFPGNQKQFSIHEVPNLSCRPCSKIGYQSCPKKHFKCMELQDVAAIRKDVIERMN